MIPEFCYTKNQQLTYESRFCRALYSAHQVAEALEQALQLNGWKELLAWQAINGPINTMHPEGQAISGLDKWTLFIF